LLAIPCVAQLPPGVLYSTTIPYSIPAGTNVNPFMGPGIPYVSAVATDASGNSYVTGPVYVTGYASTPGVVQPANAGGQCYYGDMPFGEGGPLTPCADAFIAKFDSSGTLVFLTYLGGTGSDIPISLAVDATGDIYVGGTTTSTDFPLAGTPYRPALSNEGTFIAKLSSDGTKLIWSTVLNGRLIQSAIGPDGSVYCFSALTNGNSTALSLTELTQDGQFVASVNPPGSTQAIAVGTDGSVYVGEDTFVAKLGPNLSGFAWQTSLGATSIVNLMQPAPDGSLWIAGTTAGLAFAVSPGALQPQPPPGTNAETNPSGFLVHLSTDGSKALAATYVPGPLTALALDGSGNVIFNSGSGFQATPGTEWPCHQSLGFSVGVQGSIGKIDSVGEHLLWATSSGPSVPFGPLAVNESGDVVVANTDLQGDVIMSAMTTVPGPPRLVESCIGQAGSPYASGPLAPGEVFSIYGAGFGPEQGVAAQPSGNMIGTELAGAQVLIENTPVPLLYVSSAQINLVAPYLLYGRVAAHIKIVTADVTSNEVILGVRTSAPEIFEIPSNNPYVPPAAAILNQDGTVNSQSNPAHIGNTVAMFVSGVGQTTPPGVDDAIPQAAGGTPVLPVTVQLNLSALADVTYAGNAPGLVSGVAQVNFQIPEVNLVGAGPPYQVQITLSVGAASIGGTEGPSFWLE
jgi:uncharacterized protein (TIGR03437 family)